MTAPATGRSLAPALAIGAAGLLVLGVQPALYGAYVHQGLVTEARLGTLASAEISAIALGSVMGIALLGRMRAQIVGLFGILLLIAGNLLPLDYGLFPARAMAGFGSGMVVALGAAQIAQQTNVNAASGWFLFLQATSQYAVLQGFALLAPAALAATIQFALAVLALLASPLLMLVPRQLSLSGPERPKGRPPLAGGIALVASGLFVGAAIGVWAYLGVWLEDAGMAAQDVSPRLTASLAGQIAGTLCAVAIGMRGRSSVQVIASGAAMIAAVLVLLARGPAGLEGWALMIAFGWAWMVGTPALAGLLLECDPARRSLPYGASAQLLGAAVLPTLVGELLAAKGLDRVLATSAGLAGLAMLLVVVALLARPKHDPQSLPRLRG